MNNNQTANSDNENIFVTIFDINEIQKLQDAFSKATGVASVITDPSGVPITRPSEFCSLCMDVIRKTDIGLSNCRLSDAKIGSPHVDGPRIQPCLSSGLMDGGASISVNGRHLANWQVGQTLTEDSFYMLAYQTGE